MATPSLMSSSSLNVQYGLSSSHEFRPFNDIPLNCLQVGCLFALSLFMLWMDMHVGMSVVALMTSMFNFMPCIYSSSFYFYIHSNS